MCQSIKDNSNRNFDTASDALTVKYIDKVSRASSELAEVLANNAPIYSFVQ